jgi:glutamyl-tRNA(Gln) amidotransferase subunit E
VREANDYIRFLNRSTGKVRTGIGTGREDVNVSCRGGTRVEIKGVAHTKWIPELTHKECFRQWALLKIREILKKRIADTTNWKINYEYLNSQSLNSFRFTYDPLKNARKQRHRIVAVNLPGFNGILSHFTQPGKVFANEIRDRLKVIACLEKPNMTHTEAFKPVISENDFNIIRTLLNSGKIEERCQMAFEGVPNETRKSLEDGTTIFKRVLPGADRMYPDTDSPPIPLENDYIENLKKDLPTDVIDRYYQLKKWNVPEDTYTYIFKKNLFPLIERIVNELNTNPKFTGTFFGHKLKFIEGHYLPAEEFNYKIIYAMFRFLLKK